MSSAAERTGHPQGKRQRRDGRLRKWTGTHGRQRVRMLRRGRPRWGARQARRLRAALRSLWRTMRRAGRRARV